jgi:N-acetylgalactosamine kinase
MVDLCGEGEWFVGTRGGSGDHAAIKFARRGQVAHVSFFPFEVLGFAPFFPDHSLIVCNSGIQAKKAEGARETYNRRVLGYVVGELLFKRFYPQLADRIEHLRDIRCERLGIALSDLYRMLKALPLRIQTEEMFERFGPFSPTETEKLQNILSAITNRHVPYDVRGLVLYGIAECERALRCPDLLHANDAHGLGQWWNVSHDGDRVVTYDDHWHPEPFGADASDDSLDTLIVDLGSGDAQRVAGAQLHLQPGCYACSTPEIDLIVDLAVRLPGVKGAQISGAGLGGCVMILVENEHSDEAIQALRSRALDAKCYAPVEGAGLVSI